MTAVANAGAWPPEGTTRVRVSEGGQVVEVTIDWNFVRGMARRVLTTKTGLSRQGPVTVRKVKP